MPQRYQWQHIPLQCNLVSSWDVLHEHSFILSLPSVMKVYGSSYNYDTGLLLSSVSKPVSHLIGFLVTIHSLHAYLVREYNAHFTGISLMTVGVGSCLYLALNRGFLPLYHNFKSNAIMRATERS